MGSLTLFPDDCVSATSKAGFGPEIWQQAGKIRTARRKGGEPDRPALAGHSSTKSNLRLPSALALRTATTPTSILGSLVGSPSAASFAESGQIRGTRKMR